MVKMPHPQLVSGNEHLCPDRPRLMVYVSSRRKSCIIKVDTEIVPCTAGSGQPMIRLGTQEGIKQSNGIY